MKSTTAQARFGLLAVCVALTLSPVLHGKDFFLTLGGGPHPAMNQVSLEKNVLLQKRIVEDLDLPDASHDVFFGDGLYEGRDVKVVDSDAVPKAHKLMAEFFGDTKDLGLQYRNHEIPNVLGAMANQNVRKWFREKGKRLSSGDRLIVYVAAHGRPARRNSYNTTISMWDDESLQMTQFVEMLDSLDQDIEVIVVMAQCYAGGFSRFVFKDGDPDKGLSRQRRIGFFATLQDKPAAGCIAELNETKYQEYSSYFWPAFVGRDRLWNEKEKPDYDRNGSISFEEAHAYTLLNLDSVDIPMKTSGEFLSVYGDFGEDEDSELLSDSEPFNVILDLASPSQKRVLKGLSKQLELTGADRIQVGLRSLSSRRRTGRSAPRQQRLKETLKQQIATSLQERWPELANTLNPDAISLLTDRSQEFIKAIESHEEYSRYRILTDVDEFADQKRRAKLNRLVRTADNIVFAENLKRSDKSRYEQYMSLASREGQSLR